MDGEMIMLVDIFGLIKGVYENKGLGYNFLRYVERCEALAYVVDLLSGDGVKFWDVLDIFKCELEEYLLGFFKCFGFIVVMKMDLSYTARTLKAFRARTAFTFVFVVLVVNCEGMDEVFCVFENEIIGNR